MQKTRKSSFMFLLAILCSLIVTAVGAICFSSKSNSKATDDTAVLPNTWKGTIKNNIIDYSQLTEVTFATANPTDYTDSGVTLNTKIKVFTKNGDVSKVALVYAGTIKAQDNDCANVFSGLKSLTAIHFGNFSTSGVMNMQEMFFRCNSIESIDLTSLDFGNVSSMYSMFIGCHNLKTVKFATNAEIRNTANCVNIFKECKSLEEITVSQSLAQLINNDGTYLYTDEHRYWRNESDEVFSTNNKFANAGTYRVVNAPTEVTYGSVTEYYTSIENAFDAANALSVASNVILNGDAEITGRLYVEEGKNITLDLNGNMLKYIGVGSSPVIEVKGELTLNDSKPNDGSHAISMTTGTGNVDANIVGGLITGGTDCGVFLNGNDSKLTFNGGTIAGNRANVGAGIYMRGGVATLNDGSAVTYNYANTFGGGVRVGDKVTKSDNTAEIYNARLYINGGKIDNNAAGVSAGGIDQSASSENTITMTDGSISFNTAETGDNGGLCVEATTTFTMTGGTIDGNKALHGNGGGVGVLCSSTGGVSITGGTIKNNKAATGGGIYLKEHSSLTLGAGLTFSGNTAANGADVFCPATVTHNGAIEYCGSVAAAFEAANGKATSEKSAVIKMFADATVGETLDASGKNITLDLNDCVLSFDGASGSVITVSNGANFTVSDGSTTPSTHRVNNPTTTDNATDTAEITGGVITGGKGSGSSVIGGGILVKSGGTFTMNGGAIAGNTAKYGGGIRVQENATFIMNRGNICYNKAENDAGGVCVYKATLIRLKGGAISHNSAENGGAIYFEGNGYDKTAVNPKQDSYNIEGVTISHNIAKSVAGGFYVDGSTVTMISGSISNNTVTDSTACGGGAYVENTVSDGNIVTAYALFDMTGGDISANTAPATGGGVDSRAEFTMSGGTISANSANNGGGVYSNGTFTMTGGAISDNTVAVDGGGVFTNGVFEIINAVNITGNKKGSGAEASNVYLPFGKKITVAGALTSGGDNAQIGVYLAQGHNHELASGYVENNKIGNKTIQPSTYFISDDANNPCVYVYGDKVKGIVMHNFQKGKCNNCGLVQTYYWGVDGSDKLIITAYKSDVSAIADGKKGSFSADSVFNFMSEVPWKEFIGSIESAEIKNDVAPTSTSEWFNGCSKLETIDLTGLNTECVTDMSNMFEGCAKLETLELTAFNTERVTDMSNMFAGCVSLTALDLSAFDASEVGDATDMFYGCDKLLTINTPKHIGNCPLPLPATFVYGAKEITEIASVDAEKTVARLHKHDDVGFIAWTETTSLPTVSGNYYLTENVDCYTWDLPQGVTVRLCLNRKRITLAYTKATVFGTLYLYDCTDNGYVTGDNVNVTYSACFTVKTGGAIYMYGGEISGNKSNLGGGVYVDDGGAFTMTGGKISGNNASHGGGVYVNDGGMFTMSGGEISGNSATGDGGGVYVYNGGTFTMSGGTITNNTAGDIRSGGGVYAYGTFNACGNPVIAYNKSGTGTDEKPNNFSGDVNIIGKFTSGVKIYTNTWRGVIATNYKGGNVNAQLSLNDIFKCDDGDYDCLYISDEIFGEVYIDKHTGGKATCITKAKCKKCGSEYGDTDSGNHEFQVAYEWNADNSTCTATRTCPHHSAATAFSGGSVSSQSTAPTCTEDGYITYTAGFTVDWASTQTKKVTNATKLGHDFSSDYQKDAQWHWHSCKRGGCTETYEKAAHTASDWIVDTPAQLGVKGSKHKECTVCGYKTETAEIAAIEPDHNHTFASEWTSDSSGHWRKATCEHISQNSDFAAHTASDWIVDTPAQLGVAGSKHKECTVCGYVMRTEAIEAHIETLVKPDENGGDNKVVVTLPSGFAPEIELVVTEIAKEDYAVYEAIAKTVNGEIGFVYDVTLKSDGVSVQPDGALTVKLYIPKNLQGKDFKIFHLHDAQATEMQYIVEGNYAVVNTDKLSEFVFVGEKSAPEESNAVWIVFIVILSLVIVGEVGYIAYRKTRKNKSSEGKK